MSDVQQRLLDEEEQDLVDALHAHHETPEEYDTKDGLTVSVSEILQSWSAQSKMAGPILLQLVSMYGLSIISLSFVGHLSKQDLAATALGNSFVGVLGRIIIMGLNGALDTLASQAYGRGDHAALPPLFHRSVLFLWLHAIPITLVLMGLPQLLTWQGSDSELASKAFRYVALLVPNLWLDCIARPLNSMLVAQRITAPQVTVALLVIPLHVATNYYLIHVLKMGYLGAAVSTCLADVYLILLTVAYLAATGMLHRVWGPITSRIFQGWRVHASLAYPACFMRCAESLGFSLVTLISGLLPDPDTAVAAATVAFCIYGILYMVFAACGMTTVAFVGNALGKGDAHAAKVSAVASVLAGPVLWLVIGAILVEPHSQRVIALIFSDGTDEVFMHHLTQLFYIVAMLELFDGTQTIMSGVITGSGKQKHGALVNLVAFYVLAIPVAMIVGFKAHLGVEGMYWGMSLGPVTQLIWYGALLVKTDWKKEAQKAQARAHH